MRAKHKQQQLEMSEAEASHKVCTYVCTAVDSEGHLGTIQVELIFHFVAVLSPCGTSECTGDLEKNVLWP